MSRNLPSNGGGRGGQGEEWSYRSTSQTISRTLHCWSLLIREVSTKAENTLEDRVSTGRLWGSDRGKQSESKL